MLASGAIRGLIPLRTNMTLGENTHLAFGAGGPESVPHPTTHQQPLPHPSRIMHRPSGCPATHPDRNRAPWDINLFGGFLTITIGLSLSLLGVAFVITFRSGAIWISSINAFGIVVFLGIYSVGLETIFREFG